MNVDRHFRVLANQFHRVRSFVVCKDGCEVEARRAAELLRLEIEGYGLTFRTLELLADVPPNPAIEKQVRKFWKEQDRRVKKEQKEREEQEKAWKYNQDVRPEGEGWFWVRSHQRTSCRGKLYTVRGHWRCRKTKPLKTQNAPYEGWQKSRSTDEPVGTTVRVGHLHFSY